MSEKNSVLHSGNSRLDIRGIRFRTWLMFVAFALFIVLSLWLLQYYSLTPYYRTSKVNTVKNIVSDINEKISKNNNIAKDIVDMTMNNDICMSLYSHDKHRLTNINSIGIGCRISEDSDFEESVFLNNVDASENNELSEYVRDDRFQNEYLIYGTRLDADMDSYYLIVNAAVEPVDSTVFIIRSQFLLVAVAVLIAATIVSYIISTVYSRPISEITRGARNISEGDYNVEFKGLSFSEIDTLNETLAYASKELAKTEEIRNELLANVSHDIKTPLTTIKAYAEMIEDISGDNPSKRNEHLDIIINETDHLNKLVNDMLVLTKVQSGNLNIDKTDFDMVDLSREIIDVLKGSADNLDISIMTDFPQNAAVYGDRLLIGQVIYNFTNNAIKHVGEDKKILLRITPEDVNWRFDVIDHGIGISEEEVPYIWERYYKANKTYQRNQEGSGLGLAISKAYLEAHDFDFGVRTEVGKGSDFWFVAKTH